MVLLISAGKTIDLGEMHKKQIKRSFYCICARLNSIFAISAITPKAIGWRLLL
jgi:hypothetical protein